MTIDSAVHRVRTDRLAWQQVGDESVVLDLQSSLYYSGNRSATVLWDRLVEGATTQQLVDALTGEFQVTSEDARVGVLDYLEALRAGGLLVTD